MKINSNFLKKIFLVALFILISTTKFAYSEIIKKIEISGNERLANETVILFSELNINENISSEDLNNTFKKLYDTDYFKNIKISASKFITPAILCVIESKDEMCHL